MKQKLKIKNQINWWWILLAIFSFLSILFITLSAFVSGLHMFQRGFKTYLHFTFQANLMGLIIAVLASLNKDLKYIGQFKILAIVALTIAGLVFWTILLPKRGSNQYRIFSLIGTLIAHAIVPLLAIIAFGIDCKHRRNHLLLKKHRTVMILMLYPIAWLTMAIIVYYTINYPIYSFLKFREQSIWKTLIYIIMITILFISFTYSFIYLNNKYVKKHYKIKRE